VKVLFQFGTYQSLNYHELLGFSREYENLNKLGKPKFNINPITNLVDIMAHENKFGYKMMALTFKVRDFFSHPSKKINLLDLNLGEKVLDYGCGPGSYSIEASKHVGNEGKIYAADISPYAIEDLEKEIKKDQISNIETFITSLELPLSDNSLDKIYCFDVIHDLVNLSKHLTEFHRLLKTDGLFIADDHHSTKEELISKLTSSNLFKFNREAEKLLFFSKN
jgi:ubiquinone/menaquinone biosynthesis C-methylase UbiE